MPELGFEASTSCPEASTLTTRKTGGIEVVGESHHVEIESKFIAILGVKSCK